MRDEIKSLVLLSWYMRIFFRLEYISQKITYRPKCKFNPKSFDLQTGK